MDNQLLHDRFIEKVREKIPHKSKMSNALAEILMIEKEAVYRRLRREVPFTFNEVCKVANMLGISLDDITSISSEKSRPFQLKLAEYYDPKEIDYIMFEQAVHILDLMGKEPGSEGNYSGNQIPQMLYESYDVLTRFHVFYWKYQYDGAERMASFSEVKLSDRFLKISRANAEASRRIKTMSYIWDRSFLSNLVEDIRFFESIGLISEGDKQELKSEILTFIDDIEMLAARGEWEDTGNKVYFFISNLHFDTNYMCLESGNYHLSLINTFTLNSVASLDKSTYEKMKSWINSSKRVSTLISRSGEMQRILFFAKQREIVNSL